MEDVQGNDSESIDELNDGLDDELDIELNEGLSDIIDEDKEFINDTENSDHIPLELSADEAESNENDDEMNDDEDFMDDEEHLPLDDAANWELERIKALTDANYPVLIAFVNA